MKKIEYRVRPVTRFIVTRYEEFDHGSTGGSSSESLGEFENAHQADNVATALAKSDGHVNEIGTKLLYVTSDGREWTWDGEHFVTPRRQKKDDRWARAFTGGVLGRGIG